MTPITLITPGRSGGSILVKTLASHSEILVSGNWPYEQRPGGYLMRDFLMLSIPELTGQPKDHHLVGSLYKNGRSPFLSKHNEKEEELLYRECVIGKVGLCFKEVIEDFYKKLKDSYKKHSATQFIEKVGIFESAGYRRLFPNLKTIFLIRDPRDAVISMSKWMGKRKDIHGKGRHMTIKELANGSYGKSFFKIASEIEEYQRSKTPHLVVRYEDLMVDTEDALIRILQYLDVEVDEFLSPMVSVMHNREEHHVTSESSRTSISRWDSGLSDDERNMIIEHYEKLAVRLGYSPDSESI